MSFLSAIMIPFVGANDVPATFARSWLVILAGATVKGALVLGVAAVGTAVARRTSAATRHFIWTSAIIAALALPMLSAVLPKWRAPLPALPVSVARVMPTEVTRASAAPTPRTETARAIAPDIERHSSPARSGDEPVIVAASPEIERVVVSQPLPWGMIAAIAWLAGVMAVLLPLVVGTLRVRWLSRTARAANDETWGTIVDMLPPELCPSRPVRMIESDESTMPMTWGVVRPVLLLPASARRWPTWQRRNVLLHELAHIRRYDCLTQLIAHVACAIYWFNPLVWIAAHRLRVEREHACDDQVLLAGSKATDYASHLLDVARSLRPAGATTMASVAMARPSQLAGRLLAVLDEHRTRSQLTRRRLLGMEAAALALVLPLAAFTPWHSAVGAITEHDTSRGTSLSVPVGAQHIATMHAVTPAARVDSSRRQFPVVAPAAMSPGIARESAAVAVTTTRSASCSGRNRDDSSSNISNSTNQNGTQLRSWMANFFENGCAYRINALGDIAFNRDASDVTSISAGGYFEIEERDGDEIRRVEIRPTAGGALERKYLVNGHEQPWSAEASTWLAESLLLLERHTAFAAETRVPALLEHGGVDAVLKETEQMPSDYAKRRYFTVLVKSARLNAGDVQRVVRQAATDMHSDYEMAELMITMSQQPAFDGGSHEAYAEGVARIKSDYEKRRAMTALLNRDSLSSATVRALLASTETMHSDYELAEFLISVGKRYAPNGYTQKYYLDALGRIGSDYERRRVLTALVGSNSLDAATTAAVLDAVATMHSDNEKAEMLITVAKRGSLNGRGTANFFAATTSIGSAFEKRRVLSSLLSQQPLSKETVSGVLDVAPTISSDYELAELLVSVAHVTTIDESLKPAYLKAAERIKGEYEYGRALSAIRATR